MQCVVSHSSEAYKMLLHRVCTSLARCWRGRCGQRGDGVAAGLVLMRSAGRLPYVASLGRKRRHLARGPAICRQSGAEAATSRPAACHLSPVWGGSGDIPPGGLPFVASLGRKRRHLARGPAICRQSGAEAATFRPAACRLSPVRGGSGDISPGRMPFVASLGRKWRHFARGPAICRQSGAEVATFRPTAEPQKKGGPAFLRGRPAKLPRSRYSSSPTPHRPPCDGDDACAGRPQSSSGPRSPARTAQRSSSDRPCAAR